MRANEFITELKLDIPTSTRSLSGGFVSGKDPDNIKRPKNVTPIGSGVQAMAYSVKKNPDIIIKMIAITGENDPNYQSIRVIANHQNNYFFPKIFKIKMFNIKDLSNDDVDWVEEHGIYPRMDHGEKYLLMVVMEKLYDYPNAGVELLCSHLGIDDIINNILPGKPANSKFAMAFKDPTIRAQIRKQTTSKPFAQALRLLEPLFSKQGWEADMHFGNIMRRKNGQAVIVDPVTLYWPEE